MSADHLLHIDIDGRGSVSFSLTCTHGADVFHTIDTEGGGKEISDDCWVMSWDDLTADEYVTGEWPKDITFPCPVHCVWMGDGLAVEYVGQASGSGGSPT